MPLGNKHTVSKRVGLRAVRKSETQNPCDHQYPCICSSVNPQISTYLSAIHRYISRGIQILSHVSGCIYLFVMSTWGLFSIQSLVRRAKTFQKQTTQLKAIYFMLQRACSTLEKNEGRRISKSGQKVSTFYNNLVICQDPSPELQIQTHVCTEATGVGGVDKVLVRTQVGDSPSRRNYVY